MINIWYTYKAQQNTKIAKNTKNCVFMFLQFFPYLCPNFTLWIHSWRVITDGLFGQVYETQYKY